MPYKDKNDKAAYNKTPAQRDYMRQWSNRKRSTPEGRAAYNQYMKHYRALKKYGLTGEEYDAILARGCEVCGETEGKLCLDHCHITLKNRGCLCSRCNLVLGQMEDSVQLLQNMINYLNV